MPADYDEYYAAFTGLVGGSGEAQTEYYGREVGGLQEWVDLFEETGIDFADHAQQIDAFENFLLAFYPQEGLTEVDWFELREEFYDLYGISDDNIDWEAWRAAMGY